MQRSVVAEAETESDRILIARWIETAYPRLEEAQRTLISQGLVFKAASGRLCKLGVAYGPEDDPEYSYPDTRLYPQGTIKVNFCPVVLGWMRLSKVLRGTEEQSVVNMIILEVLAHEIKHVEQYRKEPTLALANEADCPGGVCDFEKLKGTEIKFEYEREAKHYGTAVAFKSLKREKWMLLKNLFKSRPEILSEGMYWVMGTEYEDITNPWGDFTELAYESMYKPALIATKCVDREHMSPADFEYVIQLLGTRHLGLLKSNYPYLGPVVRRLEFCIINHDTSSNK